MSNALGERSPQPQLGDAVTSQHRNITISQHRCELPVQPHTRRDVNNIRSSQRNSNNVRAHYPQVNRWTQSKTRAEPLMRTQDDLPQLAGYQQFLFQHRSIRHAVYRGGKSSDPPLLLMSELAGFAPGLLMFAGRLVQQGFQVYLPWMYGPFGTRAPVRNAARLCISREFAFLRAGISAPVTTWLRALCGHISSENQQRKIGAIGMCLTGAFVIPLIIDPSVKAAVAAQPSVPLSLVYKEWGIRTSGLGLLNVGDDEIAQARQRLNRGEAHLFACRFKADRICPPEKLQRLQAEFPMNLVVREYGDEQSRNILGKRPHATFTKEYRLAEHAGTDHPSHIAFTELLAFLERHLRRN